MDRLGPQHADLLLNSFSNSGFWEVYRANQTRVISRESLIQQLQFEYERSPGEVGKIEWLVSKVSTDPEDGYLPLCLASLSSIDFSQARAEFMVGFFEEKYIKPGLGVEASLHVINYAFFHANLHKLVSYVYAENQNAQNNTIALGFKNEGLLKEHLLDLHGKNYKDVYINGLLARDYCANNRLRQLARRFGINYPDNASGSTVIANEFDVSAKFTLFK